MRLNGIIAIGLFAVAFYIIGARYPQLASKIGLA